MNENELYVVEEYIFDSPIITEIDSIIDKAKNGTRREQIPRKPLFLDCVQMNKNAK